MSSMQTIRDISQLSPSAQTACNMFLAECRRRGLDIFITETYRTQERQDYLYSLGRTKGGSKVTWTQNSRHTSRRAWDIACNAPHSLYDGYILKKCGEVARDLDITWGGDWSTPDYPHFEISEKWEENTMQEIENLKTKVNYIDESLSNLYSIVEKIKSENTVYNSVAEIPDWARDDIAALVNSGALQGDENGRLNLSADMLRLLVILKRLK